jgi:hypothetical protein
MQLVRVPSKQWVNFIEVCRWRFSRERKRRGLEVILNTYCVWSAPSNRPTNEMQTHTLVARSVALKHSHRICLFVSLLSIFTHICCDRGTLNKQKCDLALCIWSLKVCSRRVTKRCWLNFACLTLSVLCLPSNWMC